MDDENRRTTNDERSNSYTTKNGRYPRRPCVPAKRPKHRATSDVQDTRRATHENTTHSLERRTNERPIHVSDKRLNEPRIRSDTSTTTDRSTLTRTINDTTRKRLRLANDQTTSHDSTSPILRNVTETSTIEWGPMWYNDNHIFAFHVHVRHHDYETDPIPRVQRTLPRTPTANGYGY